MTALTSKARSACSSQAVTKTTATSRPLYGREAVLRLQTRGDFFRVELELPAAVGP